ncbi:MAG TPA: 5-formyltetrahydrofolate cyclo-ligase [Burkholderiales bacterium]|nr:5-formyltetrahydrofolate cyclo-ligase [Burkholderiales bacterium]
MKDWNEIKAWRKTRRAELIAQRTAFAADDQRGWNERIGALLEQVVPAAAGTVIGFCWPYKGEFDARFAVRHWRERGATAALPEVVTKAAPLRFHEWRPGAPMKAGVYGIPVPDGTPVLAPDIAIVPMNGFDGQGYRLGYGGGFFDRTLAALERRVLAIGVSYEALRVPTIYPQPHDIPMDFVVTEAGIYRAGGVNLVLIGPGQCAAEAKAVMERRDLPRQRGQAGALPETGGYASPACSAHEIAPDYFGVLPQMTREEVLGFLNTLLEAERAGAKVLAAFLDDYERESPARRQLAAVQRDEARNCAILIDLVQRLGGAPSAATGDFLGKALAVEGRAARLQFLNRGQAWVARKIAEALPGVKEEFVRGALSTMHESHLLNIEACEALAEAQTPTEHGARGG